MDNVIFLQDLAVVMMVAGLVALLFRRLRQPVILGYIVAGLIVGPHMPPFLLVQNVATIETLAQLGVVFLMFSLGLEFSFRKLRAVGLPAMITSVFEILVMIFIGHQMAALFGWSPAEQVFLGCILAVSSTAMIITSLRNSGRIREDHGQFVAGLLIMEDVFVILMMVLLPGLARTGEIPSREVLLTILRLFTFLVGLVVAGLITVPRLLRHVARHNSDEMLLITTLALCFGTALLAVRMEFSVALGAFIMGAIIAEAREAPRIERLMAPVRDLFMAVFFVAIGMLIQPSYLLEYIVPILVITLVFVTGKLAACAAGAFITGRDLASSLRIGANMAQLGEFAFVLAAVGRQWKVTGDFLYPVIAGVTVLNAVLRPYLIEAAEPLAGFLRRNLPDSWVSAMTMFNRRVKEMGPARRRNPVMKHVWSLAFQIGLNLTLIAAGFITGAMIAGRFPQLLAPLPGRLGQTQIVPWLLISVLLLPLYVATIRKMQAMGLLLSELAMEGAAAGSPARPFLGHLLSTTMFLLQLVLLGLVTLLVSATMLPSWQTFLVLLVITGGLAVIFGNLFNRHYTRAKVALLETWYEPAHRPNPDEKPEPHEELQTVVVSDHPAVTGMRNGEIVTLSQLGVSLVAIRRAGINLLHPAPDEEILEGDGLLVMGTPGQLAAARQFLRTGRRG